MRSKKCEEVATTKPFCSTIRRTRFTHFEDLPGRRAPFFELDALTHRLFARQPTCRQVLVVAGTPSKSVKFRPFAILSG